ASSALGRVVQPIGRRVRPRIVAPGAWAGALWATLGLDGDRQLDRVAGLDAPGHRAELVDPAVVAEDAVGLEAHLAEVCDALAIAVGGIDRAADVGREGDLRRRELVRVVGRLREAGIDLEVDVRPPAGIARGEDAREGDDAVAAGLLDPAEVVLVRGALGVERVAALTVAVPHVHRSSGERRAPVRGVLEHEADRQWHALRSAGRRAEARADVLAHDAALRQDVRP